MSQASSEEASLAEGVLIEAPQCILYMVRKRVVQHVPAVGGPCSCPLGPAVFALPHSAAPPAAPSPAGCAPELAAAPCLQQYACCFLAQQVLRACCLHTNTMRINPDLPATCFLRQTMAGHHLKICAGSLLHAFPCLQTGKKSQSVESTRNQPS